MASSSDSHGPSNGQFQLQATRRDGTQKKYKYLTCTYWTRGECRYTEAECKYAHGWTDLARGERYIPQGAQRQELGRNSNYHISQQPTSASAALKPSPTVIENPLNVIQGSLATPHGFSNYSTYHPVYATAPAGSIPGISYPRLSSTTSGVEHHNTPGYNFIGNKNLASQSSHLSQPVQVRHHAQIRQPADNDPGPRLNPNAVTFELTMPKPKLQRDNTASERTIALENSVKTPIHVLIKLFDYFENAPGELEHITRDIRRLERELQSGHASPEAVKISLARYAANMERLTSMTKECREAFNHIGETG